MKTFYLHNKCRKQWGNKNGNNPTGGLDIFVGITSGSTKLDQMLECFPMYLNKIGQFFNFWITPELNGANHGMLNVVFWILHFFWCCTGCSVAVHCWILRPMSFAVRGVLPRDIRHIVPHRATSCHIVPHRATSCHMRYTCYMTCPIINSLPTEATEAMDLCGLCPCSPAKSEAV
jgi:hypothetical protein